MRIIDHGLDQRLLDPLSPEARELRAKGIFPVDVRLEFVFSGCWPLCQRPGIVRPIEHDDWLAVKDPVSVIASFGHSRLFKDGRIPFETAFGIVYDAVEAAFREGRGVLVEHPEKDHVAGFVT